MQNVLVRIGLVVWLLASFLFREELGTTLDSSFSAATGILRQKNLLYLNINEEFISIAEIEKTRSKLIDRMEHLFDTICCMLYMY